MTDSLLGDSDVRPTHWRDRLACRISNFALRHIATPWYCQMIDGAIRYGLRSAARDAAAARAMPLPEGANPDDYSWMGRNAAQRPDVEFTRRGPNGSTITYGHIYWRPLVVHVLGRTIIGRRKLRKMWEAHDGQ